MKKKLNLPNALSLFRVALIPIIVAIMLLGKKNSDIWALVIFCTASLTDFIDGRIARKYNLVTNLGKLLDPLADKMMVVSVLLVLVKKGEVSVVPVILIVMRELAVTGLRAAVASATKGELVMSASMLGKIKTNIQIFAVIVLIMSERMKAVTSFPIADAFVSLMTVFTLISGIEYFVKANDCLKD